MSLRPDSLGIALASTTYHFAERVQAGVEALSDGPNAMPLTHMAALLETLVAIDRNVKQHGYLETELGLAG